MSDYPTLDRIAALSEESNKIGAFIDWLQS